MGLCQGHLEGLGPYTLNVSKSPLIIVTTKKMLPKVFLRELVLPLLKTFDCVVGYSKRLGFYSHYSGYHWRVSNG